MTTDFKELTHAEMRAVYEQNLKDFKELQRKAQVVKILEEMSVPETRKDLNKLSNLRWLQRNLLIQNGNHPRVTEVIETIKVLAREKSKQIQQLTKLPTM
jgi:hypothetical protein